MARTAALSLAGEGALIRKEELRPELRTQTLGIRNGRRLKKKLEKVNWKTWGAWVPIFYTKRSKNFCLKREKGANKNRKANGGRQGTAVSSGGLDYKNQYDTREYGMRKKG